MTALQVSNAYIENIEKIPRDYLSIDDVIEQSENEEDFSAKMDEIEEVFEQYDNVFYGLALESTEIEDKILKFIRENVVEFFEIIESVNGLQRT